MVLATLTSDALSVSVNSRGAELSSIRDAAGHELLWQAGPVWPRHAPILFPIIGQLPGGILQHDGVNHPIGQHGFARDSEFNVVGQSESMLSLTMHDSEVTRMHFPFGFKLDVVYELEGSSLTVTSLVSNPGEEAFSASFGEHPAFAWPILPGVPRGAHTIVFEKDEPGGIRRISNGLLRAETLPSPVDGATLTLDESLFIDDAIIFDELESRSVTYSAPGTPAITVAFPDFPQLGIWSKIPGEFVCIEPWFGMTAPEGFTGDYAAKPGQFRLAPGESKSFTYVITVSE